MNSPKRARHGFFQQPTRYLKQALNLRKQGRCVISKPLGLVTVAMPAAFLAMGMKEHADFERAYACYAESDEGGQIELVFSAWTG